MNQVVTLDKYGYALPRVVEVDVTVDASGDAVAYTPEVAGKVYSIQYIKTDYADGVDFTIVGNTSGQGLWTEESVNAAKTVKPTDVDTKLDGSDRATVRPIVLGGEKIKITIANGGASKTGTFRFVIY